jgi:aminoglycoside phosphotransferase (APT) family kinase protein
MAKSKAKRERERRERRFASAHEPTYDNREEVVECGGELWWAVDFTAAGFPIGLRLSEMKDMEERAARSRRVGWAVARDVLRSVFGPDADIGRVTKIGEGLSHDVFAAYVECPRPHQQDSGSYTVSLPGRHADSQQIARPDLQPLLTNVAAQIKSIRVPLTAQSVLLDSGMAIVRPFLEGVPLDLRAGRQPSVKPHEVVAKIAAAVHSVDLAGIELRGHATRRAHAEAEIDSVFGAPELAEAELWAREHLPPDEPSTLIHGDLLGQNILVHPEEPPAVLDWEYAGLGDPAYDLAVVTRGKPKPFDMGNGFASLIGAYTANGGKRIQASEVRVHELCLVARWYQETATEKGETSATHILGQLRNVLRRARAEATAANPSRP